jgi:ferredoxin-NADP reductase
MLRHRAAQGSSVYARLLVSSRRLEDVLYADELARLAGGDGLAVHFTLTRGMPAGWEGFSGRIDASMVTEVGPPPADRPRVYVCGPTAFVEHAADLLVALGHPAAGISTERFGPTGI